MLDKSPLGGGGGGRCVWLELTEPLMHETPLSAPDQSQLFSKAVLHNNMNRHFSQNVFSYRPVIGLSF